MDTWEYLVTGYVNDIWQVEGSSKTFAGDTGRADMLAWAGSEGWELVAVTERVDADTGAGFPRLYFKRRSN